MLKYLSLTFAAGALAQEWAAPADIVAPAGLGANPAPAMDPMMMMMLMGDKGGMKDMLPMMMMSGGLNGQGAPMDPMMMMTLMGDDAGSMKDLLPLMMMNGNGAPMDPMMMMTLMGDDSSSMKDMLPLMMMQGQNGAPMDPMMMMMMMGDDSSSMKDMLPLMMMNGGNGAPMDPMMMMTLMGDDSSSMKDMLPLMMMQGGEQGAMNPMMMMSLLDEKTCDITNEALAALDLEDSVKEEIAAGKKIWNGSEAVDASVAQDNSNFLNFVDYGFMACKKTSSGMSDMLPLMMQGGAGGQMDPMMMLSMLEGGDMSEMLPLMMMNGGEQGAMNPMMMMSLLGDDGKSKDACNKKFKMTAFEATESEGQYTLSEVADTQAFFENGSFTNAYTECLEAATEQSSSKDSGMKDLLPLMMMNQPGGAMDPMTMMMMME